MNTPFTTASLYLDIISSLYGSAAKANLLPPTKLFSDLKTALKTLGPEGWRQGIDDEIFARALRLTKNARHLVADDQTAAQLVLYSLTHNLLPLNQVALLKKDCVAYGAQASQPAKEEPTQSVDRMLRIRPRASAPNFMGADPSSQGVTETAKPKQRSRYLFPLRQSQRTPRQLQSHIAQIVNALFRRARLPQATDPYQTVEALWAYAALRAGIPASALVAHLGHVPLGLPVLRLSGVRSQVSGADPSWTEHRSACAVSAPQGTNSRASDLDSSLLTLDSSKEYFSQVGKIFLENEPRWYAMQLRPGVRFTDLTRRIELLRTTSPLTLNSSPLAEGLELFYPSEEISRLIGKKIVTRQRPFIHSVVFFRAKLTDIGRLFSKIGDLAWCYRQSARPGAPYADISDRQFQLFQQTIARFTPDYEVAATGDLALRAGDRVEILGGLFQGQQAIVESRLPSRPKDSAEAKTENAVPASPGVIYRLNIVGDNGIDWRISVDPRLLKTT